MGIVFNSFVDDIGDKIDLNRKSYEERKGFLKREVGGRLIAITNIALTAIAFVGDSFRSCKSDNIGAEREN